MHHRRQRVGSCVNGDRIAALTAAAAVAASAAATRRWLQHVR